MQIVVTAFRHDLALFALNTGARHSEMAYLRWNEEVKHDSDGSPLPDQLMGRVFHIDPKKLVLVKVTSIVPLFK